MKKNRNQCATVNACRNVIELLENRCLLSASVGSDATLNIAGTDSNDSITVKFSVYFSQSGVSGTYAVTVDGNTSNFDAAPITNIAILGGNGNDTINLTGYEEADIASASAVNISITDGSGNNLINSQLTETGFYSPYNIPAPTDMVTVGDGNNNVFVMGSTAATIYAGNGNDTLSASANTDDMVAMINVGNGNNFINGVSAGNAGLSVFAKVGTGHDVYSNNNDPDIGVSANTVTGQTSGATQKEVLISGRALRATGSLPIVSATVYLDANNNGILDAGETSTATDSSGNYSLRLSPLAGGDLTNYNLRIIAPGFSASEVVTENTFPGQGFSGDDFVLGPVPTAASPTLFGTTGSYHNLGNTNANAVDGDLNTYFDGPDASGDFVALDYGSPQNFSQLSFAPRAGLATRMVGGVFQASNSPDFSNAVTLDKVTSTPSTGVLTNVNLSNIGQYRYVRYYGPTIGYCNIAEMQFTVAPIPGLATIANHVLTITGTNGTDNLNLTFATSAVNGINSGSYVLGLNGKTATVNSAGISSIVINSLDGANDVVDVSGTENNGDNTLAAVPITINEGNGNDTVIAYRQDNVSYNNRSYALAPKISVTVGNGNDQITAAGGALQFITAGNGNDTITVQSVGDNVTSYIYPGNGNDSITASVGFGGIGVQTFIGTGHDEYYLSQGQFTADQLFAITSSNERPVINSPTQIDFTGRITTASGTPVEGVTVYSDMNNNDVLDPGEVSAVTDSTGVYNLLLTGITDYHSATYDIRAVPNVGTAISPAVIQEVVSPSHATSGDDFVQTAAGTATHPVLFGTTGTYSNGNTISKAVDGNLSTYFDAPIATGAFVALDYGSPQSIKQISYAPRAGWTSRMVGGLFQASNSSDFTNAVTLYRITSAPVAGKLTTVGISSGGTYRYVRYIGPANSNCNIAEMSFTLGSSVINPTPIGTAGSYRNHGTTIANAFDGNLTTFFDGPDAGGDWVGEDFGSATVAKSVTFAPRIGWESRMVGGLIQASNNATFSSGVVTLAKITTQPASNTFTTLSLNNSTAYRYYRYIGPANSYCDIAELQFGF